MSGIKFVPGVGFVWQSNIQEHIKAHNAFTPNAEDWWFQVDGTEGGAGGYGGASQTSNVSANVTSGNVHMQVRVQIAETGGDTGASNDPYDLQYEVNDSGTWTLIDTTSANVVIDNITSNITNGAATTDRITGGTGTFSAGVIAGGTAATTSTTGVLNVPTAGNHTEILWGIILNSDNLNDGDTIDFRVRVNATTFAATMGQPRVTVVKQAVAPSGSIAQTLPSITQISAGSEIFSGSAEQTFPSITQQAAGYNVANYGSIVQTLPAITQQASGLETISGSIGQTLPSVTQISTGRAELLSGSIDQTLPSIIQCASDGSYIVKEDNSGLLLLEDGCLIIFENLIIPVSGTISQILPAITQQASGSAVINISGSIVQTLFAITQSATGLEIFIGSIAQTLPAITQSSAGAETISGSITQTLPAITQTATGLEIFTGAIAQTLSTITQNMSGAVANNIGSIAQTLSAITQQASGIEIFSGSIAQILPSITQQATGYLTSNFGSIAQTLPAIIQQATGSEIFTGTIAQTLPAITQQASGSEIFTGTIAQTLPAITQSASGTIANNVGSIVQTLPALEQCATNLDIMPLEDDTGYVLLEDGCLLTLEDLFTFGSITQTLLAITQSASGTIANNIGSITQTLPATTQSASGTISNTSGSIAQTLPSIIQCASDGFYILKEDSSGLLLLEDGCLIILENVPTLVISGTIVQILPTITQQMSGVVANNIGSIVQTLPALEQCATNLDIMSLEDDTGYVLLEDGCLLTLEDLFTFGSITQTFPAITQQLSGHSADNIGSITQTLPAVTQQLSGHVADSIGSITQILPRINQCASDGSYILKEDSSGLLLLEDGCLIVLENVTTLVVSGTIVQILPAITQSASGTVPYIGSISQTLPAITQAATGQEIFIGSIVQTLPAITQSASGLEIISGSITQTLPAITQATTGQEIFIGSIAQTLPAITQSASGSVNVGVSGSVAQTLPAITQSANGLEIFIGSIAQTLPAITQQMSGAVANNIGSITQTLPVITQTASGLEIFSGSISQTLPVITQSAAGVEIFIGAITQTLPAITQLASGTNGNVVTGTIVQTLPAITQSAAGLEILIGAIAQTLPAITQSASGSSILDVSGSIVQTLPAITQLAFESETTGTIDQTLPAITQSLQGLAADNFGGISQTLPSIFESATAHVTGEFTAQIAQTLPKLVVNMLATTIAVSTGELQVYPDDAVYNINNFDIIASPVTYYNTGSQTVFGLGAPVSHVGQVLAFSDGELIPTTNYELLGNNQAIAFVSAPNTTTLQLRTVAIPDNLTRQHASPTVRVTEFSNSFHTIVDSNDYIINGTQISWAFPVGTTATSSSQIMVAVDERLVLSNTFTFPSSNLSSNGIDISPALPVTTSNLSIRIFEDPSSEPLVTDRCRGMIDRKPAKGFTTDTMIDVLKYSSQSGYEKRRLVSRRPVRRFQLQYINVTGIDLEAMEDFYNSVNGEYSAFVFDLSHIQRTGTAIVRFDGPIKYTYKVSAGDSLAKTFYDIDVNFVEVFD